MSKTRYRFNKAESEVEFTSFGSSDSDSVDEIVLSLYPLPKNMESEENDNHPCGPKKLTLGIFTVITAFIQSTQNTLDMHNRNYPLPLVFFTACIYFFSSLGLKRKYTIDGIDDTYQIIRDRTLPADWSGLSIRRNLLAGGLSGMTISCVLFSDVTLNVKNLSDLPATYQFDSVISPLPWNMGSSLLGGVFGANMVFGEGKETFRTLREAFSDRQRKYSSNVSRYVGFPVGITLALSSASLDTLNAFTGINKIYSVQTSLPIKFCIGSLSLFCGISDFCMNGQYAIDSIDQLLGAFSTYNEITGKQAAAFFAASMASGWLAYVSVAPTMDTLNGILVDTGLDAIPYLDNAGIKVFTVFLTSHSFIINTAAILDFSYDIVKKTGHAARSVYKTTNNYIQAKNTGNNSFLFFSAPDSAMVQVNEFRESIAINDLNEEEINEADYGNLGRCPCQLF